MAAKERHFFHPLDYVLLTLSLVTSLGVGMYQAMRGQTVQTTSEYLMGGRRFSMLPVALSLIASFISSIALIGLPAEIYFHGITAMCSFVAKAIGVVFVAYFLVPLFHPLNIISVQEYLEMRFKSRSVRLFGTCICLMSQLFYTGCVVYGQAAALEATTGLPYWGSIILVNTLGTIYTAFGGMKAVIWTDVFQVSVMFFSMIVIIIIGMVTVGGPAQTLKLNNDWNRLDVSFDLGIYLRMTFWSTGIGSIVGWVNTYGVNQTAVQRYCAVSDVNKARKAMLINMLGSTLFVTTICFVGMVTFAYYVYIGCDPYSDGQLTNKNQILPLFIMDILGYPGVPGLFVSGLFSGSLSTISSNINSMCAVIWEDIFKERIGESLSPKRQVTFNQCIAGCVGIVGMGVTFLVHGVGGSLMQIAKSLFGICSGPSLGVFILGSAFPWCNWIGALSGGISSLTIVLWMFIGQIFLGNLSKALPLPAAGCHANSTMNMTMTTVADTVSNLVPTLQSMPDSAGDPGRSVLDDWFYSISFMWYGVIGITICITIGMLVSAATGFTDTTTVEKRLLLAFVAKRFGKESKDKKIDQKAFPLLSDKDRVGVEESLTNNAPS